MRSISKCSKPAKNDPLATQCLTVQTPSRGLQYMQHQDLGRTLVFGGATIVMNRSRLRSDSPVRRSANRSHVLCLDLDVGVAHVPEHFNELCRHAVNS